jgi:Fe-S cluster assembly protein SufD
MSEGATAATTPFSALHAEFAGAQGTGPTWLQALRHDALARFESLGIPTTHHEDWRHTSLAPIARTTFRLPAERSLGSARPSSLGLDAHEAVFVNGRFAPWLSSLSGLPAGVRVASLAETVAASPERISRWLARIARLDGQVFTALNTAFLEDGAYVHLEPATVVEKPIHLLFYSTNAEGLPTLTHPRTLVVAERGSQARIVETYAGPEGEVYFTNAVTELALGENAAIEHYKMQRESEQAFHVGRVQADQARASQLSSYSLSFGGSLVRTDIDVTLGGEGASCGLYGLFLGHGRQHVDHHTEIDHAVPHCSSRELYKGVLDEQAKGVFFGTILVRPDAQKTDAQQTNKNLLLSKEALVTSTPRLEIEADDVRCKHGSTTGQIDPTALFYLRSRGVGEAEARSLLTYAFAADVLERVTVPAIRKPLASYLSMRLPGVRDLAEVVA